jgi:hypothetical protein
VRKPQRTDHSEDLMRDKIIILKWVLMKLDVRVWTQSDSGQGPENVNASSGFIKCWKFIYASIIFTRRALI